MNKRMLFSFVVLLGMLGQASLSPAMEIKAAEDVFELGDVLVKDKGGNIGLATTVNTITVEEIKKRGAQSVAEALDFVPGIDVQANGKNTNLKLRGFDQVDVKVLIDGVPAHESYFGSLDLDLIPVDSIARIEVTKGASSVLYGSNTMGGVINIITKKGGKKPVTTFTTSFGENNTQNYAASHGAALGKFNYWMSYGYRSSDGFELSDDFDEHNGLTGLGTEFNEDGGTRDLSDFIKRTANAKLGYEYDTDSKVYLSFDYHNNEKGCPTHSYRYWKYNEWDQWQLNLVGQHDVTDRVTMKARMFYVDHDDTLEDVSWDEDHSTPSKKKWFETSSYDDKSYGGEVQAYVDLGPWSQLKLGMNYLKDNHKQQDYIDTGSNPGLRPQEEYEADTYSFAVENEILAIDKLSMIAGFSYDTKDPKKANNQPVPDKVDAFNPQMGIVYDVTDTFALHASVGKKTRFPQLKELYSKAAGGNPDLDAQQTIAYEVGASKQFNQWLNLSMALFYNDIDDRIVYKRNDQIYTNIGESTIKGVEFDIALTPIDKLDLNVNYTWLSSKDRADSSSPELDAEDTPEHKLNLGLGYAFDFGLSTFLQASYTSDQIEYDKKGNEIEYDSFFLINARLVQKLPMIHGLDSEIFLDVKNLMDEDYEESNGPMPGRNFLAGMTLTF
ncbi:MAG: TonB-dependent receptor [Desulfobacteraceae bacterium]|nr:TonB-dependent receptor [Desulfobacteraceae bacterium]